MIVGSLARRYARALLEIGIAQKNFEKLSSELEAIATAFSTSRELSEALTNPIFPRVKRRAVLEAIITRMAMAPASRNFLLLLLERERLVYLPSIARELKAMVDEKAGRARGVITSARPLPAEYTTHLQKALSAASGRQVQLEVKVDPAILAGVVAQVGDLVFDGSARTQIEALREIILME